MITLERMHFVCPSCGLILNLPEDTKRIICRCQFDSSTRPLEEMIADRSHYTWQRLAACEQCCQYMGGERCKLIELGCRNRFRVLLHRETAKCPIGVWEQLEAGHVQHLR